MEQLARILFTPKHARETHHIEVDPTAMSTNIFDWGNRGKSHIMKQITHLNRV